MKFYAPFSLLLATILANSIDAAGALLPFEGQKTTWHDGFVRFDYMMDEATFAITPFKRPDAEGFAVGTPAKGQRRCIVVAPQTPAAGQPWSWQGCYWDHEPQTEVELLRRGFHIVFITPDPGPQWDAWYEWLTEQHGLSKKPAFIGMSKGGVNEYDWTTANPTKVSCIYADNPAIRPEAFARLSELAKNDVALLNICGSADFLLQRHTLPIEDRYQQLGGSITVMIKDGQAHHPHSLRNPNLIADWIVEHTRPSQIAPPAFADEKFIKSYYYSLESTNIWLKEEKTFANCRGPGFVECYDRYDEKTSSQWGLTGLSVIVPKTNAPGKPWVFRADNVVRDAVVDQALLAKGFHIVITPLTAQSGAVRTQWNNAYQLMIDHGFAKKPVLAGTGTAAGEAYAWAIENTNKVACIYARNPALRSLMSPEKPIDHLDVLAKAGIPLLHVCDGTDPWFADQTKVVEQRYKTLGGQINILINDGDPRSALSMTDVKRAADFIVESVK